MPWTLPQRIIERATYKSRHRRGRDQKGRQPSTVWFHQPRKHRHLVISRTETCTEKSYGDVQYMRELTSRCVSCTWPRDSDVDRDMNRARTSSTTPTSHRLEKVSLNQFLALERLKNFGNVTKRPQPHHERRFSLVRMDEENKGPTSLPATTETLVPGGNEDFAASQTPAFQSHFQIWKAAPGWPLGKSTGANLNAHHHRYLLYMNRYLRPLYG